MIVDEYASILAGADIPAPRWFVPDKVEEHVETLGRLLDQATRIIADAALQLLFADRTFLVKFNEMIARSVATLIPDDHPCVVRHGEIARPSYLPI